MGRIRKLFAGVSTVALLLSFMACSGDDSSISGNDVDIDSIDSRASVETKFELGNCDYSRLGDLVYVKAESAYYVCSEDAWYRESGASSERVSRSSSSSLSSSSYSSSSSSSESVSSSSSEIESSSDAIPVDTTVSEIWNGKTSTPSTEYKDGKYYMIIRTAEELAYFAKQVNDYNQVSLNARLEKNIRLNADDIVDEDGELVVDESELREWEPIGNSSTNLYKGVFDGNGHTISGIYINNPSLERTGFFGTIGGTSTSDSGFVFNLGIVNSYIVGGAYVGAVAGRVNRVQFNQIFSRRSVVKGTQSGGIVGYQNAGVIRYAYNNAYVTGTKSVGGIVGYKYGGTVDICYNVGFLTAPSGKIAGISYSGNSTNSYFASQYDEELVANKATEKDSYYMEGKSFANTLNQVSESSLWTYDASVNDEYPVFSWEVDK